MSLITQYPGLARHPQLLSELADLVSTHAKAEADYGDAISRDDRPRAEELAEVVLRSERRIGQILIEARRLKDAWIAAARKGFVPSRRQPCLVCGKWRDVSQAHHVIPLARQYDKCFEQPDHEHVWLCPTHHAIVHLLLIPRDDLAAAGRTLAGIIAELDAGEHADIIMRLLGMAGYSE
jgi:hypothetical protein